MENKTAPKTPEKRKLSLDGGNFSNFKPSLNTTSNTFVPTSAPKVDFSPTKEPNAKSKTENLTAVGLKFDLNAPVFTPSFVP
jgi:hypothetical protein